MTRSLMMVVLGLLLATVGQEAITAIPRFTFGSVDLQSGLDLVPLIMGLFGISEVLLSLEDMRGEGSSWCARRPDLICYHLTGLEEEHGPIGRDPCSVF
jgi:TctA family transporter